MIGLEQTRLPDLAADPSIISEVLLFSSEIKSLALTCCSYCHYLRFILRSKVENLWLCEKHLHPADPDCVPPRVETLQSELLNLGQEPHDHDH